MLWYRHWFADYDRDTGHFSLLEHGAYVRLLHRFYETEKPLPKDADKLCRLVGAHTADERKAMFSILYELWVETDDGWVQRRAQAEIAKSQKQVEKSRNAAKARWHMQGEASGTCMADGSPSASQESGVSRVINTVVDPPSGESAISLPTKEGSPVRIAESQIAGWEEAYPSVDVRGELLKMREWLIANPAKGKTRRGMSRFAVGWLGRRASAPADRRDHARIADANAAIVDAAIRTETELKGRA